MILAKEFPDSSFNLSYLYRLKYKSLLLPVNPGVKSKYIIYGVLLHYL